MRFQQLIRALLPKEERFFELLEQHAEIAVLAAETLNKAFDQKLLSEAKSQLHDLEEKGDRFVANMIDELSKTFITPIDREDLLEASKELDSIIDLIELSVTTALLLGITSPSLEMISLASSVAHGSHLVQKAVKALRNHEDTALRFERDALRDLEKEADQVFRTGLSRLFQDPAIDAKTVLREREILEHLEEAVDRCDDLGDALLRIALKHG